MTHGIADHHTYTGHQRSYYSTPTCFSVGSSQQQYPMQHSRGPEGIENRDPGGDAGAGRGDQN